MSRIDSNLLIDRYHSTENFNQNILQNISEDDHEYIQRQSPCSPNTTRLTMKLQASNQSSEVDALSRWLYSKKIFPYQL